MPHTRAGQNASVKKFQTAAHACQKTNYVLVGQNSTTGKRNFKMPPDLLPARTGVQESKKARKQTAQGQKSTVENSKCRPPRHTKKQTARECSVRILNCHHANPRQAFRRNRRRRRCHGSGGIASRRPRAQAAALRRVSPGPQRAHGHCRPHASPSGNLFHR